MLVLDASLAGPLVIPDEAADIGYRSVELLAGSPILVPMHWRLEVANMLRSAVRRQRLTASQRDEGLARLAGLPVVMDTAGWNAAWSATIAVSDRHDLTPYDAAYLELAIRRAAILATRDRAMARAARAENIEVTDLP